MDLKQSEEKVQELKLAAYHSTPTFKAKEEKEKIEERIADVKPEPVTLKSKGKSLLKRMQFAIKTNLSAIKLTMDKLEEKQQKPEEAEKENREAEAG